MKYEFGQELFAVDPFVFTIHTIIIYHFIPKANDKNYPESSEDYWCDTNDGYWKECDLFTNFESARNEAINKLENFYHKRLQEINDANFYSNDES